jgi:hypothetical protein
MRTIPTIASSGLSMNHLECGQIANTHREHRDTTSVASMQLTELVDRLLGRSCQAMITAATAMNGVTLKSSVATRAGE